MQPTRRQILDYLRRYGKGSVQELGDLLGLTSTGIRQHLTILERDGLIEGHEERGRVGRPALVYSLTDLGDALYPKKYAALASLILEQVRATSGDDGVQELLSGRRNEKREPYLDRVAGWTYRRAWPKWPVSSRPRAVSLPQLSNAAPTSSTASLAPTRMSPAPTTTSAISTRSSWATF